MERKVWLLVASAAVAKFYENAKVGKLSLVQVLEHPASRLAAQEIETDARGQEFQRVGHGANTYEPSISPTKHEASLFAHEVSHYLEKQREKNAFDRLYIAAAPGFLGLLRERMSKQVADCIVSEESKDVTELTPGQLIDGLSFAL